MLFYTARRLATALVLLLAISFITYAMLFPAVDDVARNVLGETATEDQVAQMNAQLGLDRPLLVQYFDWLGGALTGDLGVSYFSSQPVGLLLAVRIPVTVSLVALVTVISGVLAFGLGTLAALKRGWIDRVTIVLATIGDALPAFILGLFLVTAFALQLGWLPATGYVDIADSFGGWVRSLLLPVVTLTIVGLAGVAQQVRSSTLSVMEADFVRTLRSRGLPRWMVIGSVMRNSAVNGMTALAVHTVGILGGAVLIENVFALPGLGSLVVTSTTRTDIPLIIGIVMAYVVIVVVINLLVDLAVAWLNPKARLS